MNATDEAMTPSSPPACGAERSAWCACGQVLPSATVGRPRLSCSSACRRQRDAWLKQLRRRTVWLSLWRAEAGGGRYSRSRIRFELQTLQAEQQALALALSGGRDLDREQAAV